MLPDDISHHVEDAQVHRHLLQWVDPLGKGWWVNCHRWYPSRKVWSQWVLARDQYYRCRGMRLPVPDCHLWPWQSSLLLVPWDAVGSSN